MNTSNIRYLLISIVIFSIIALTGCRRDKAEESNGLEEAHTDQAADPPASIAIAIIAKRGGIVVWLIGQEGTLVDSGQIIARLNDDEAQAQFRQAELEVNRAKVEVYQSEALVKVNQAELERQRALFKDGIVSRSNLDQAQYKFDNARHELEKTRLAIGIAEARVGAAKMESDKANIRSPITGIITHSYVKLAAGIVPGEKLFEVSQLLNNP